MIVVVGDTPSSVKINAGGSHWIPIQDGGRADTSAPIGSVSLWGVYVYYVYGTNGGYFQIESLPTKNPVLNSNGVQCKAFILKTNSLSLFTAQLHEFQKTLQMRLCEMEIAENTLETKHPHIPNSKYSEQKQTEKASKKKVTGCTNC